MVSKALEVRRLPAENIKVLLKQLVQYLVVLEKVVHHLHHGVQLVAEDTMAAELLTGKHLLMVIPVAEAVLDILETHH